MQVWMSWSGGKDGALALATARATPGTTVAGLQTTVVAGEVSASWVPRAFVEAQAAALGLPLETVELPWPCPNDVYEQRTGAAWAELRRRGASEVVYGDLFLADVRAYRERALAGTGLAASFPLWGRPTAPLATEMLDRGVRAVVVCVDPARVPATIVGRTWDAELIAELPADVDPCGENGEFHTLVTDGPGFAHPVPVRVTGTAERDGFVTAVLGT
ncbi:MAG: COG2102: Predicted ATPases of PP-loop superfamily [uncultured Actinomycetospora sp.]|uniref:COG2102: Predicted ATPases of PP-loop superfamily n=1 Tax=uncultured Actinomycetospora sp. TaxID=1135996 RepID=A0A6J4JCK8_9PSEU|nr:MAG: COG2102: Predicted ATPases of PP-loop superfamily [uncultured Actinomycetospora sp.]